PALPPDDATVEALTGYLAWYLTSAATVRGTKPVGRFSEIELVALDIAGESAVAGVVARTAVGHAVRLDVPLVRVDGSWQVESFSQTSS
ncbi:MAG: hypothetical protein OEX97_09660, partial [Acidimicrobiia bacterium]|nr:hypothetical protein [Acidimicrobiia bacterium]